VSREALTLDTKKAKRSLYNMPKLKTNKSAKKRLKLTKTGKLRRFKAGRRHLLTSKSSNRKRGMRKSALVEGRLGKITKKLLPYG